MTGFARDQFSHGNAVIFCFVGQHRAVNAVAHRPDTIGRFEVTIRNLNNAALVGCDANGFKADAFCIGLAPDCHDDDIRIEGFCISTLGGLHRQLEFGLEFFNAGYFLAKA